MHYATHSAEYGFEAKEVSADLSAIVARSRGVAESMSRGVDFLLKKNKVEIVRGVGRITGKGAVEVISDDGGKTTLEAAHIIIATGSRPNSLPFAPIDGKDHL